MSKVAYLGSVNTTKVAAAKSILEPYGYEIMAVNALSHVSNQPIGDEETITGALNRALSLPVNSIRIGLEAGVTKIKEQLFLINYGVLIDENNRIFYAGGTRIVLPPQIETLLLEQKLELKEAMAILYHEQDINHKGGAIGLFTNGLVNRIEIFEHIIKLLWGQYLKNNH